jgi:hypothetical protein
VFGLFPANARGRRHRALHRRGPQACRHDLARPAPAAGAPGGQAAAVPGRLRRAQGPATTPAPSRSPPASASRRSSPSSRRSTTTTARSCSSRWPTASPKPRRVAAPRVRREYWGYAADETLDNAALIPRKYRGIRPAPGYPACPDHTVKGPLFKLLGAREAHAGMGLTESYAMMPAASVSGFYLAHPESRYFAVRRSAATSLRTGRAAPAWRWTRPHAGWRRCSERPPVPPCSRLAALLQGAREDFHVGAPPGANAEIQPENASPPVPPCSRLAALLQGTREDFHVGAPRGAKTALQPRSAAAWWRR